MTPETKREVLDPLVDMALKHGGLQAFPLVQRLAQELRVAQQDQTAQPQPDAKQPEPTRPTTRSLAGEPEPQTTGTTTQEPPQED